MKNIIWLSFLCLTLTLSNLQLTAQDNSSAYKSLQVYPETSEGLPIKSVIILIHKDGQTFTADSTELEGFYRTMSIYVGSSFNRSITNMAMKRIALDPRVSNADYQLYSTNLTAPVVLVVNIYILGPGQHKSYDGRTGIWASRSGRDFPLIFENNQSELTFILNGAAGLYNEVNPFFSEGKAFTQGNPIADDPGGKGVRFWGETFLEPGVGGILEMGNSGIYAYGAVTGLFSARNTTDIYSSGAAAYGALERLYAGIVFTRLSKKGLNLNLSYGRQTFQLNDGFLISKYSGSSNAGFRGSVYLNSRTSFNKAGLIKLNSKYWALQMFYLEPQELYRFNSVHTTYAGSYVGFNNNKHWDVGIAYINRVRGKGTYQMEDGAINQKGLYVINPKLWISNIGGKGLFFKSEYAFEGHSSGQMRANAWYAGAGVDLNRLAWKPMFYYRYAFMQGQKANSKYYTRFDPMLTGGLGDWVQGINMRKVLGNGNIITHRIQARINPLPSLDVSLDYFHLSADSYINLGGLAPISKLKSKKLGDELTLTTHWYINRHFMLLGLCSFAFPGKGLREAVDGPVKDWSSVQLAMFMFF